MDQSHEQTTGHDGRHDEVLALLGQGGNREARNALYLRHTQLIRHLAQPAQRQLRFAEYYAYTNVTIDAEDVEQQAFISFCDLLESWRPDDEPFMRYMKRLLPGRLRHYVRDTLRYRYAGSPRRTVPYDTTEPLDPPPYDMPLSEEDPQSLSVRAADWEWHMAPLPDLMRESLNLRFREDLTSTMIAGIVGRSKRTVNRNLKAALGILRASIPEPWEECE